jgi:hypothetical protein
LVIYIIIRVRVRVRAITRRERAWEPWVGGRDTFGKTLEGWATFGRENMGFGDRIIGKLLHN